SADPLSSSAKFSAERHWPQFKAGSSWCSVHWPACTPPLGILYAMLAIALTSFSLTALGFVIAWPMDSTQAFHAIINLVLIPLWLGSGALFPVSGASGWLRFLMLLNPL